jgi:hypothetical protein
MEHVASGDFTMLTQKMEKQTASFILALAATIQNVLGILMQSRDSNLNMQSLRDFGRKVSA